MIPGRGEGNRAEAQPVCAPATDKCGRSVPTTRARDLIVPLVRVLVFVAACSAAGALFAIGVFELLLWVTS